MWSDFIPRELQKHAGPEEELLPSAETVPLPPVPPLAEALAGQIETIYQTLSDEEHQYVCENVEKNRKKYGLTRTSPVVAILFARNACRDFLIDYEGGRPMFKQRVMPLWDTMAEKLLVFNPVTGETLKFIKFYGISADQNVYLAEHTNTGAQWIVKWESSEPYLDGENVETVTYNRLKKLGASCPNVLSGFKILEVPVLVIELLQPLDITDDAYEMAKQLLLTQLKYIHTFACYFDLKTDNVKKRPSVPPVYFIIDMNLSEIPIANGGYSREHFTPLYTSQTKPTTRDLQYSCYRNDLVELLYVIHQMIAQRAFVAKYGIFGETNGNITILIIRLQKNWGF